MLNQSLIIEHFDGFQLLTVINDVMMKFLCIYFLNEWFIQRREAFEWVGWVMGRQ